jgi:cytochrome c553
MKRPVFFAVAVLAVLVLVMASAYSQEDMEYVSNEMFDNPQRGSAVFVHDEHNETAEIDDCAECHHIYDDEGNKLEDESSEDQACAECHGDKDDGHKPKLIKAFHQNCKGCHLHEKKGPILCAECHTK